MKPNNSSHWKMLVVEKPQPQGNSSTLCGGKQRGKGSHRPKGCRHSLVAFEYLTQLSKISVFKTPREGKIEPRDVLFQILVLCICSCKTVSIHGLDALSRGLAMLCLVARTLLSPEQGRKPAFSGCYFCSYCPVVKPQALPLSWCWS